MQCKCMVCCGYSNYETIIRIGFLVTNFGQNKKTHQQHHYRQWWWWNARWHHRINWHEQRTLNEVRAYDARENRERQQKFRIDLERHVRFPLVGAVIESLAFAHNSDEIEMYRSKCGTFLFIFLHFFSFFSLNEIRAAFFAFFFCLPFDSHVNYRHERMLTGVRVVPNKCYRFCCYGRSWTVSVSTRRLLLVHRTHTRKRSSGKQGETKEEEEKKQNGGRSAVMRIGWPIFQRITCDSILWTINPSTEFQNHENSNLEKKEDKTKKLKYLPVFRFRWPFQGRVLISKYEYFFLRHHTLDFPSARIEMMPFRVQYSRIFCLFFVSCD